MLSTPAGGPGAMARGRCIAGALLCAALLLQLGQAAGSSLNAGESLRHARRLAQVPADAAPDTAKTAQIEAATLPPSFPATFGPPPPYNISLPPFPVNYAAAAMDAQRNAGSLLQANIDAAIIAGNKSYTIPAGVYRLSSALRVLDTVGFTLNATGVELVVEVNDLHLFCTGNVNLTILGPLLLDASFIGVTQGVMVGSDGRQNLTVQLMDGYPVPLVGGRVMFFNTSGAMYSMYQIPTEAVTANASGRNYFDVQLPQFFWDQYPAERAAATQPGNLVSFEQQGLAGGVFLGANNGVTLLDLSVHSFSLVFIQEEIGPILIDRLYGTRRPGTNRLGGGGYVAASILGGSLTLRNSELAYNFDDLTDLQSGMGYAAMQSSPTQVAAGIGTRFTPGDNITFLNVQTLQTDGSARVVSLEPITNQSVVQAFQDGLTQLELLTYGREPMNLTLDRPVNLTGTYDLMDNQQTRAKFIMVENCYMHDSLASGINAKGAQRITIRNNTVSRAGYRGAAVGFDPYWWEGPAPFNTLIENNRIDSTPYLLVATTAAINTYVDTTSSLMDSATASPTINVTIRGNTVLNPRIAAIGLQGSTNNVVTGNTIVNPVASVADRTFAPNAPYSHSAAIYVDFVGSPTFITNNTVYQADLSLVPQIVRASPQASSAGVSICNNSAQPADGARAAVPNAFWKYADSADGAITYSTEFGGSGFFQALGSRFGDLYGLRYADQANATASFAFNGTRARFYGCTGAVYGTAAMLVDGAAVQTVDASVVAQAVVPSNIGFCGVVLFDTGALPAGGHTLAVRLTGAGGAASIATYISVVGFDFQTGASTCAALPSPPPPVLSPPPPPPRPPPPPPPRPPPPPSPPPPPRPPPPPPPRRSPPPPPRRSPPPPRRGA